MVVVAKAVVARVERYRLDSGEVFRASNDNGEAARYGANRRAG